MKNITYKNAITELEEILQSIQSQNIGVDDLTEKVNRASELIKYCKEKLKSSEEIIQKVFEDE